MKTLTIILLVLFCILFSFTGCQRKPSWLKTYKALPNQGIIAGPGTIVFSFYGDTVTTVFYPDDVKDIIYIKSVLIDTVRNLDNKNFELRKTKK